MAAPPSVAANHQPRVVLTAGFGAATFLGALGTDGFLPALVALAHAFDMDVGRIQLAVASFFFGGAIGQAIVGPLADRFGRRPILLGGIALYAATAATAVWATDITVLIALRALQGAAGSSGRIVVRAIVRDLYARDVAARVMSYMTVFGTCIPIFAPMISAQLVIHFDWRAVFLFMAAFAAFLWLLLWHYVDESLAEKNLHAIRPMHMLINFIEIGRNRMFLAYGALAIGGPIGLSAFLSGSSAVLIGERGLDPDTFSFYFSLVMASNAAAAFVNARLIAAFGYAPMLAGGVALCAAAGIIELTLALAGVTAVWAIIGPMMAYMVGMAFVQAPAQVGALVPFAERAGAASSLMGIVQGLLSTLSSLAVGFAPKHSAAPMATVTALAGVAVLLIYLAAARKMEAEARSRH
jgi:DHA1 family bicyclomycin/chloramphenicol resistance-like MFS transporter